MLRRRRTGHTRFLELLSRRLDEPLRLDEAWQLTVHLSSCQRCRAAEHEYAEQRRRLRSLPDRPVPRDLGARVSAALDREVLRRPGLASGGRRLLPAGPRVDRHAVGATAAVVSVTALTVGALVVSTGLPQALPDPTRLRPTPMAVPGQALAYLGAGPDGGLALYRTSVDRVCPVTAIDCVTPSDEKAFMALSRNFRPNSIALSPGGDRLLLYAQDTSSQEDVFAVVFMSPTGPAPVVSAPTDNPPTTPVATPTQPSAATPGSRATERPALAPATPPPSTDEAPETPPLTIAPSSEPAGPDVSPLASPRGAPSLAPATPVPTDAALTMVAILDDVRGAGAAPAWSPDGSMLAFSAMPSDGSHGPDVYVWQPGDASARPVTSDHASYFASWSGGHVVASRASPAGPADDPAATLAVVNVLLDPVSGSETSIAGPAVWLPQINGTRTRAVGWHGEMELDEGVVRPVAGQLYVFDWALVDPFATLEDDADQPATTDAPEPDAPATDVPSAEPSDQPLSASPPASLAADDAASPTSSAAPRLLLTLPPMSPRASEEPSDSPAQSPTTSPSPPPTVTTSPPALPPPPSPAQASPSVGVALTPLEPQRDGSDAPVLDWEVRWAPDGTAFGYWIADAPGASWGRLTVLSVGEGNELGTALMPATLARRSFALGMNRIAWVAPADGSPEGELRITAWGPGGSGVLRLGDPDLYGVAAAF